MTHILFSIRRFITVAILLLAFQSAYAVRYQFGDFVFDCNYSWNQLTATLIRYAGTSAEVTIPEEVFYDGNIYPVLYIGDEFSVPFQNNAYVQTVRVPNNALSIGVEAFSNCTHLESVILGYKLERIEAYAFYHCPLLHNVKMYNKLTDIGAYAFAECPSLSSLRLGRGVTHLCENVFDLTPLQSLTLLNPVPASCNGPLNSQTSWYNTCQVYVHLGSQSAFDEAPEWSRFTHLSERAERGDVNADGLTDITDVNILINCMLGRAHIDNSLGDLTNDGSIDISDVNILLGIMLGNIDI